MKPKAQQDKLLVEKVGDELVIYDQQRHRAHRLNRTASLVWRHCDGQKTVADIATLLQKELSPQADGDLVCVALDRLEAAHLLQEPIGQSKVQARTSRRLFVRKVGLVGILSLLLPVVQTIIAPTPAQAASIPPPPPRCGGMAVGRCSGDRLL